MPEIHLTLNSGRMIRLDAAKIAVVKPHGDGSSEVCYGRDHGQGFGLFIYECRESVDTVQKMLAAVNPSTGKAKHDVQ